VLKNEGIISIAKGLLTTDLRILDICTPTLINNKSYLAYNDVSSEGCSAVARILKENNTIEKLVLCMDLLHNCFIIAGNKIQEIGVENIANSFNYNTSLISLYMCILLQSCNIIGSCSLGSQGVRPLAQMLSITQTLREIWICNR
jgi:hypothetical protein